MSDIFHDLVDAGEHAVDAVENVGAAGLHALEAGGRVLETTGDNIAAAADEFTGDYSGRDEWDRRLQENKAGAEADWNQAGQDLSNAGGDIYNP